MTPSATPLLSTAVAALPVVVLLGGIGIFELRAHVAALLGLLAALAVAILAYGMPAPMAGLAAAYGAAFGLLPIGWIILNVIFLYQLTSEKGEFAVLQRSIGTVSDDRRMQLLFIAFCLGAFFEGAAGFGTPVAVTAAMLMGLGFTPLAASGLVAHRQYRAGRLRRARHAHHRAFGRHRPRPARAQRHGRAAAAVLLGDRAVLARSSPSSAGARRSRSGRPSSLPASPSRYPQYLVSNFHGPWLVDIVAAIVSMASLALFLRVWRPATPMTAMPDADAARANAPATAPGPRGRQLSGAHGRRG